jgi:type VI protein secretion system component VasF
MSNDWAVYIFVFVMAAFVMARLDRLGNQLEAVSVAIRADVARRILSEWKEAQKEAAKDKRRFWIFWGVVGAAAVIWAVITHRV